MRSRKVERIPTANSTAHQSKSRSPLVRRLHGCVRQPFTEEQAAYKAALLGGVAAAARVIGRCTESGFLSRLFPLHSVTVAATENRGESQVNCSIQERLAPPKACVFHFSTCALRRLRHPIPSCAGVAELADALDSKSGTRKSVWVRAPPPVKCDIA